MAPSLRQVSHVLVMSLWRRKSVLMAIVMCATILVLCLQYSSVGGANDKAGGAVKWPKAGLGMDSPPPPPNDDKAVIPRRNLTSVTKESKWIDPRSAKNGWVRETVVDKAPLIAPKAVAINNDNNDDFVPALRLVHLDMKGAPPKISYLKQLLPMLKEAGANGILLEYEDTFPYWGTLAASAAGNAYTKEQVGELLREIRGQGFEVIPLVQTFGHLEYVLKLDEYKHMREVDDFPQAICPSRNDSLQLVKTIIDQMVELHPDLKWIHIGCDEVYHLGYCNKCMQQDRENLFLKHVAKVATYVRQRHNLIPIVWDDMLRQIPGDKLKQHKLGSLVEPMIWTYVKDVYRFIPYNVWLTYSEIFPYIWGASAYKGAFGETLTVPNVKMHLENHEAWLEVLSEQKKRFTAIRGLALTGWQRYDHFGTLCELLPSGIPSLMIDLLTTTNGKFGQIVMSKFQSILGCTARGGGGGSSWAGARTPIDFEADPHLWSRAANCFFPGVAVFKMTQHHADVVKRVNDFLYDVTVHKAWLTEYNIRRNMSSPMRVDEGLTDYSSNFYPVTSLMREARDALREVYDEFTVSEWIEQNIYPYVRKMEKLWKDGADLKKAKTWPKRPLPPLQDLKRFQIGENTQQQDQQQLK